MKYFTYNLNSTLFYSAFCRPCQHMEVGHLLTLLSVDFLEPCQHMEVGHVLTLLSVDFLEVLTLSKY